MKRKEEVKGLECGTNGGVGNGVKQELIHGQGNGIELLGVEQEKG